MGKSEEIPGLLEAGNINLHNRPKVHNPKGGYSTILSTTREFDGTYYVLPTVSDDGKFMSQDEAAKQFMDTGRHLGKFASQKDADAFAQTLHDEQDKEYRLKPFTDGYQQWDAPNFDPSSVYIRPKQDSEHRSTRVRTTESILDGLAEGRKKILDDLSNM